jgi:hypothetical protein
VAVVVGHGVVPIKPDFGADFHRNIQREGAKATDGLTKQFKGAFSVIAKAAGAMFVGTQVISVFKSAFAEAAEAQKIGRLTEQVIKSTGGAAKITAKQIGDLSTAISNKAGIDDEAIQSGANLVATFTRVRNEAGKGNDIFSQTVQVATDMSVALGQDMKSSSLQLGKALNDPIKGVTALTRAGVSFTQQQKDQIKALQESGDLLGAQKLILAEVQVQFGGAAAAAASPVEKLKVVWGNLLEELGTRALPVIETVASWLGDKLPDALDTAGQWFRNLRDAVTPTFRFIVNDAIPALRNGIAEVSKLIGSFLDGLQGRGGEGSFLTDMGEAARGAARVFTEDVLPVLKTVWSFIQDNLKPILIGLAAVFAFLLAPLVLLVGGFIYAYQKFDWFRTGVGIFMDYVKLHITTVIDIAVAAFRFIAWIIETVVVPIFNRLKDFIVHVVAPLVSAVFRDIIVPAIQNVATQTQKMWDTIQPVLQAVVSFVQDKLGPVWEGMRAMAAVAFQALPGLIGASLRLIGGIVAGFLDGVGGIADAIGLDDIAKVLRNGAGSARGWGQGGPAVRDQGAGQQLRNKGGPIYGPNVDRDIVPAMLTPGEFVMRRGAVQKYGPEFMEKVNAGRLHFRSGGLIPDIDLPGFADGIVDKARDVGTSALDRVWPRMPTGSDAFTGSGLPAGGANYLRDAAIALIRGKEAAMGSQSGGGFTRAGGGGPAGQYTAGMQRARADILNLFGPMAVGGYANRNIAGTNQRSAHAMWRAWDFMTGKNVGKGNAVSRHLIANASKYGLKGLIWNAQKNFGSGWAPYRHPGGGTNDTLMHRDHVHAEFFNKGGLVHLKNFDGGGTVAPGWNAIRNDTGRDEHLIPRGSGPLVGVVNLHNREDVDEFWRRAEFASMAGRL